MIIKRYYRSRDIDLGSIRAVRDALSNSLHWTFSSAKYELYYSAELIKCNLIAEVESIVEQRGHPARILFQLKSVRGRSVILEATDPAKVTIEVNNLDDPPARIFDPLECALQLTLVEDVPVAHTVVSAFVAHTFSTSGQSYANEISRFLTLTGLSVYSGRAFSPTKVSEKVQAHLIKHDIIVAILTATEDPTWLVQEMAAAAALSKPLFVLREEGADFKEGGAALT